MPVGVVTGEDLVNLLTNARDNAHAIASFNYASSTTAKAVLEAAKKNNSPVMIQASNGGGAFVAGKGIGNIDAAAIGSVALAMHVRTVAPFYGVPVTPTIVRRIFFRGSTKCLRQTKNTLHNAESHYFPHACLIFPKSRTMRTSQSARSTSNE